MADVLALVAGAALAVWGSMHLWPTRQIVASFGDIGTDNRRVLTMEWIAEGVAHVGSGVLVILVAALEGSDGSTSHLVYRVVAGVLVALAALTTATGARTGVVWYRICPVVLAGAAALLLVGSLL